MLIDTQPPLSEFDRQVFDLVVPVHHYLRQVATRIDFERFRPRLVQAYCANMGRPAIDPVRMLKILFLRFHYKLPSDRLVMERAQTDMAFRWFLNLPLQDKVPHHTDGTHFRCRIGAEGFAQVFQELVTQAREAGLVKDRLRLKDATHLFANVADVQPLQLAAQVRERLLQAAAPFFADWVSEQRAQIETLRQTTAEFPDDERLAARVEHLRGMSAQLQERAAQLPPASASERPRQRLRLALDQLSPRGGCVSVA
ncbi:MAG: transposase [Gemmataceae bacterium]|nr:transposase [Gemmataceae bacterium]